MPKKPTDILYCDCGHFEVYSAETKQLVRDSLCKLAGYGINIHAIVDLCGEAAERSAKIRELAKSERLTIFACHPRAVEWLFERAGHSLPDSTEFVNLREKAVSEDINALLSLFDDNDIKTPSTEITFPEVDDRKWTPWFPVLDYSRCVHCGQCMNFCLFGVYSKTDDGKIQVSNPENCKLNCPACARVCPKEAIIFPKYHQAPVNGGEPAEGNQTADPTAIDLSKLGSQDIYKLLRERTAGTKPTGEKKGRFGADASMQQALKERLEYLKQLDQKPPTETNTRGCSCECGSDCSETQAQEPDQCKCNDDDNSSNKRGCCSD